jgi:hypothetical protein
MGSEDPRAGQRHHHGCNVGDMVCATVARRSRDPLRPNQAQSGPDLCATPTAASTLRVAATTTAAPTPHPRAFLALLTHATAARRLAPPLLGRQLARREWRSARGPASVVGSTASPAASSDGGEGGTGGREEGAGDYGI